MLEVVGKVMVGVVIAAVMIGVGLVEIKGTPDYSLVNRNTLAKAYLDKNADKFAQCDHSLTLGATRVSDISLSYLRWNSTDVEKKTVNDTEKKFMNKVHAECDPVIDDYKNNFEAYKQTSREIAKAQASLFDKLINSQPQVSDEEFASYEPSYVSMTKGGSGYVFTNAEIQKFFSKALQQ